MRGAHRARSADAILAESDVLLDRPLHHVRVDPAAIARRSSPLLASASAAVSASMTLSNVPTTVLAIALNSSLLDIGSRAM